ncbi:hypothetical protein Cadr_000015691 [Camelus dromedarius]|uniref:Uncharacterized protein n=1 Tax=Camelus dromedarius TaxID=9838 RepID=A0A5N4E8D2_CAMDR|nr:hypothetical protein Cadr_000015691 [Camelus dromedarius]
MLQLRRHTWDEAFWDPPAPVDLPQLGQHRAELLEREKLCPHGFEEKRLEDLELQWSHDHSGRAVSENGATTEKVHVVLILR